MRHYRSPSKRKETLDCDRLWQIVKGRGLENRWQWFENKKINFSAHYKGQD